MKQMQCITSRADHDRKRNHDLYYLPMDCIEMALSHGLLTALPTESGDN
jgi:hypothetical protein